MFLEGVINFTVIDTDGNPVVGADVEIVSPNGVNSIYQTDDSGCVYVDSLESGDYIVRFGDDYETSFSLGWDMDSWSDTVTVELVD